MVVLLLQWYEKVILSLSSPGQMVGLVCCEEAALSAAFAHDR